MMTTGTRFLLLLAFSGCGTIYLDSPDAGDMNLGASVDVTSTPIAEQVGKDAGTEDAIENRLKDALENSETHPSIDAGALSEKPPRPSGCYSGALYLGVPDDNPCKDWCTVANQVLTCL